MSDRRLYRSETDRMLGGVCGGLAEVYDLDPALIRLLTVLLIFSGVSPLLYLIAWLVIPSESEIEEG
ncbi:MAG: PspC domain-containing protein [Candidatus Nanosalina sp.]